MSLALSNIDIEECSQELAIYSVKEEEDTEYSQNS
jgi:hypothetical protein